MINTLKLCALVATAIFMMATPASSQAPTDAQRSAIRSECRADYQAHCASVPPGGEASLECLAKNMSNLSAGCASAVKAVEPAAAPKAESAAPAPKAETAPAAAPAKPAATTAAPAATPAAAPKAAASAPAKKPTDAQVSAIRSACRSDYQKVCAGVPAGGSAALQCLEKNKAKTSGGCQQALNVVSGGAATPAAGGATATAAPGAAAAPEPALKLRPMLPREELFVLRSSCSGDVRGLCGGVAPGGGRIMQCLANQAASITPACKQVLMQFAAP